MIARERRKNRNDDRNKDIVKLSVQVIRSAPDSSGHDMIVKKEGADKQRPPASHSDEPSLEEELQRQLDLSSPHFVVGEATKEVFSLLGRLASINIQNQVGIGQ